MPLNLTKLLATSPLVAAIAFYVPHVGAIEFGAEYLLEITTDLDQPDSNNTNTFGLGIAGVTHHFELHEGELTAHNSFMWLHGESLSNTVGDVNGFSNIFGPEVLRLNHLWLQYDRAGVSARVGRFDVDEHFMGFDSGADLLNSSFGALATATANMPLPTYPVPGLAGLIRYEYAPSSSITLTLMDGDVGDGSQHDNFGFDLGSSGVGGLFLLTELRHTSPYWNDALFMIGLAFHSGEFSSFDNESVDNNGFVYVGMERQIFAGKNRELVGSVRLSTAPFDDRNVVTYQADLTLTYRGAFALPNGVVSIGFVYAGLSDDFSESQDAESAEWVAELNYRYNLTTNLFVVPSIQYIHGGTLNTLDIVVGMLRLGVSY
ncbi:MAG: carbohydrate porin [Gammaproteobacteria bacterium]